MAEDPTTEVNLSEREVRPSPDALAERATRPVRFSTDPRDVGWVRENVPCQTACPANTNIPAYIRMITEGRVSRSYELNRIANVLPGVLGRVCSRPCEAVCRHGWPGNGEPVAICYLKRVAADHKPSGHRIRESLFTPTGKRIAIVGAGPAGVAAAYDLTTLGHDVTLYEREQHPGGMLRYGIPEFRLPRDILAEELRNALRLGVELKTGVAIGNGNHELRVSALRERYDAVMLATGCVDAVPLPLRDGSHNGDPARRISGVEYGLEFLVDFHRGDAKAVGKRVAVVGAGFTALDCARVAWRLGAEKVAIHIRTGEEYIPVTREEIYEAKREGIEIHGLRTPVTILHDTSNRLTGVRFTQNRLGGWRSGGRREAIAIEGSEFVEPCDTLLIAIGQRAVNDYLDLPLEFDRTGNVRVGADCMTSVDGVFAIGDYVTGPSTVIDAIGHGRRAAQSLDTWLMGRPRRKPIVKIESVSTPLRERSYDFIPLQHMPTSQVEDRLKAPTTQVELGYDMELAREEARRCYLCYLRYHIDIDNCIYCRACMEVAPRDCIKLVADVEIRENGSYGELRQTRNWNEVRAIWIDNNECIRCGACYTVCPTKCISITRNEMFLQDI